VENLFAELLAIPLAERDGHLVDELHDHFSQLLGRRLDIDSRQASQVDPLQ
jgi:hypothetical protein